MPYIEQARRVAIDSKQPPQNAGELNYALTTTVLAGEWAHQIEEECKAICLAYLKALGPLRYQFINEVMGACYSASLEFERRGVWGGETFGVWPLRRVAQQIYLEVAAPYEDLKRIENGDISYV